MTHACKKVNNCIRCECGGQVACEAMLYPLVDFGIGFVNKEFVVNKTYGKKVIGYTGFCLKCKKRGRFLLPEQNVNNTDNVNELSGNHQGNCRQTNPTAPAEAMRPN